MALSPRWRAQNLAASRGDGGPAIRALLDRPSAITVGADGSLYIADNTTNNISRVRRVGPDGTITTMAGTGLFGFAGDGGLATQAGLGGSIGGLAMGADGNLYIASIAHHRIRQVRPLLPGLNVDDIFIAVEDGSEVYHFNSSGRHLRTLDSLTGTVRFQFTYNSAGKLVSITDGDGNMTTIERDGSSNSTAIVASFGQRTTLSVNNDGYLSRVTNPAGESVQLTYYSGDAEGLLSTLIDPRNNVHRYNSVR